MRAPEGISGDQGWLGNLDQPRARIATPGLGAVGRRADMVGLGRSGYRDWVGGAARGLGRWAACQTNRNSTVFRGLAVAANVGAVATAMGAVAASSIAVSIDAGLTWRRPLDE